MSENPKEARALQKGRAQLSKYFLLLLLQPPTKPPLKAFLLSGRHLPPPTRLSQKPLLCPTPPHLNHLFSHLPPHCP